ncbi:MAG TPA: hypothetical protein VFR87_19330 [Nocardioidaceae bacterium]|nr:hypothetical protein [Nocardioidaceae bacterium]
MLLATTLAAVATSAVLRWSANGGQPASDPAAFAIPTCPPTTLTLTGPQSEALERDNDRGTWDLSGAVWVGETYPIRSERWTRGCVRGGEVDGGIPRALTRDEWYDGDSGAADGEGFTITVGGARSPWLYVEGLYVHDTEDAYDPNATSSEASTYLERVHAEYIRDDCIENEQGVHSVYVNDSFFDGCFTAFAERPPGSESTSEGTADVSFVVENSLVHVQPQPLGDNYCDEDSIDRGRCVEDGSGWLGSYGIWKWSDQAAAHVEIRNSIFRLDLPSYSSCLAQEWPPGVFRNVTVVWTGPGDYATAGGCRNKLPRGVRLTTDLSIWNAAVAAWSARNAD